MAVTLRRPVIPAVVVMTLGFLAIAQFFGTAPGAGFLAPPKTSQQAVQQTTSGAEVALAGAAAGLLTAQPAHAGMLYDEIIPYASATSFAILWGIVLGFVLLRLQEAFPE
eukprot:TRINITY_DN65990_c0_g1_i1.p2 TRINITY_DN65990_c0_g1~~TRINITY_DN65990_c0_g1_i1.p2  ORF type:complete len:110 (+),score=31.26 TRINITY_DN65990_c0_g1_i1:93-422(+)